MAVPKAVNDVASAVKARIAARDAEIAQLEKELAKLRAQKSAEEVDLAELETAFPGLVDFDLV